MAEGDKVTYRVVVSRVDRVRYQELSRYSVELDEEVLKESYLVQAKQAIQAACDKLR